MTNWEPGEKMPMREPAWMLIDWQHECRVVACAAEGLPYRAGDEIGWVTFGANGVGTWIEEMLCLPHGDGWLIPLCDGYWLVYPQYYLATGYLLLMRLPVSLGICRTWVQNGVFGEIAVFPELLTSDFVCHEVPLLDSTAQHLADRIRKILPVLPSAADEEDMADLLRGAAALCGMTLREEKCEEECLLTESSSEVELPAPQDLPMFAVMSLCLMSCLRRLRLRRVTRRFNALPEGTSVTLTASLGRKRVEGDLPEIEACRELTERNSQIFSAIAGEREWCITFCTVRKDYALLGVKIKPSLTCGEHEIEKESQNDGTGQTAT